MRRFTVLLAALLGGVLAVWLLARSELARDPHSNDFTAYWAAGRLNLDGKNPYGAADLLALERTLGWQPEAPLMLWNPPWMLTVLMAFGAVDFALARSLWLVLQVALTAASGLALWRFYGGPPKREPIALALSLGFAPLILSLKYGQIGPLCFFGLTAFLLLQERKRDFLAGAALSLASLKPHLVYMVWPAVAVWSLAAGRGKVLAGLIVAGLVLAVIPALVNTHVYADFLKMVREPPPPELAGLFITRQDSPTFGWQLRVLFGKESFSLQYLPTAVGLAWLLAYGYRHRRGWDWADRLPVLLLASVATAPGLPIRCYSCPP